MMEVSSMRLLPDGRSKRIVDLSGEEEQEERIRGQDTRIKNGNIWDRK